MKMLSDSAIQLCFLKYRKNHDSRLHSDLHTLTQQLNPDIIQIWFVQKIVLGGFVAYGMGVPQYLSERFSAAVSAPRRIEELAMSGRQQESTGMRRQCRLGVMFQ